MLTEGKKVLPDSVTTNTEQKRGMKNEKDKNDKIFLSNSMS